MNKILANEFVAYKSGFLDGKSHVLEQALSGDNMFLKDEAEDNWYSYGYVDGYHYYFKQYLENKMNFEDGFLRKEKEEAIQSGYMNRVIEWNQEKEKKVPVAKFKLKELKLK